MVVIVDSGLYWTGGLKICVDVLYTGLIEGYVGFPKCEEERWEVGLVGSFHGESEGRRESGDGTVDSTGLGDDGISCRGRRHQAEGLEKTRWRSVVTQCYYSVGIRDREKRGVAQTAQNFCGHFIRRLAYPDSGKNNTDSTKRRGLRRHLEVYFGDGAICHCSRI